MKLNPITEFILYFNLALAPLLIHQVEHLFLFIPILSIIAWVQKNKFSVWLKKVKPFIIYFPILGFTFIGISLLFTHMTWNEILFHFSMATMRLWIMVSLMSFYLLSEKKTHIITALRSARLQLGFNGKLGEDFILFIETILRFLPNLQSEWEHIFSGRKSLGLSLPETRMDKIKSFSNELPYFIHNSLKTSEQLTQVMVLRGYGKQSRRGVYPYNPLTIYDGLIISAIMLTYGILEFYGAI